MKLNPKIETKIAETAFCWLEYGNYGSQKKAIKALLKLKGMDQLDKEIAGKALEIAVEVLNRTKELKKIVTDTFGKQEKKEGDRRDRRDAAITGTGEGKEAGHRPAGWYNVYRPDPI